jgi:hypothetical protein
VKLQVASLEPDPITFTNFVWRSLLVSKILLTLASSLQVALRIVAEQFEAL